MNIFGRVAVRAVELIDKGKASDPADAWRQAVTAICSTKSMQEKVCPRCAFLGLCRAGLVKGVPKCSAKSSKNGDYAVQAAEYLRENHPSPAPHLDELWCKVTDIEHNGQMDVVIALWETEQILRKKS